MYMPSLSDNLDNLGTQTTQSKPTLEIIRKWFINENIVTLEGM